VKELYNSHFLCDLPVNFSDFNGKKKWS